MTDISIVLGNTPAEMLLKTETIKRPDINLNFTEYANVIQSFPAMVRDEAFDIGELSLVTLLQAIERGKPFRMLPVIINGAFHHKNIYYDPKCGRITPESLNGKRVGVRSYTQTMGMWIRGVLEEQYGVLLEDVTWVYREEPHLKEYACPANTEYVRGCPNDLELIRRGNICAIMATADKLKGTGFLPLIQDAETVAQVWQKKHQTFMLNHLVTVKESFATAHPDAVQSVYDMLREAIDAEEKEKGKSSFACYGAERIWESGAIQLAMQYSIRQKLLHGYLSKERIFADVRD